MKLNFEQIKAVTTGAEIVKEYDGGVRFSRFTEEQNHLYRNRTEACYLRSLSSAGIKLAFVTDSRNLKLRVNVSPGSSRKYFSVDVFVNGKSAGSIENFSNICIPQNYIEIECELNSYEKSFDLGEGTKDVVIYLPWSMHTVVEELSLDDGATIKPLKRKKTLLAFGDSITQGYDALYSSGTYISKLALALDADEVNKGIGGEMFFPELAESKESFVPDYVTVAYGINDWSLRNREDYEKNCREFFVKLCENYPDSKKIAITPIWTALPNEERLFGEYEELDGCIRNCIDNEDIIIISGVDLMPHDEKLFADCVVHPSDKGFEYYFENLFNAIKNNI